MTRYYVNTKAQPNGDHEVHRFGCVFMPVAVNRNYLGDFTSCRPAVAVAKRTHPKSDGCYFCSRECHTS
ncbi:MAG: hypothetical protein OEV43_08355 [Coriobacteriia bacterium]|nr:hypothetical protein [Coriobacteriia bacterium]